MRTHSGYSYSPATGAITLACAGFIHTGSDTCVCGYLQQEQETDLYELLACQVPASGNIMLMEY